MKLQEFTEKVVSDSIDKYSLDLITTITLVEILMKIIMELTEKCEKDSLTNEIRNIRLINKLRLHRKLRKNGCIYCDDMLQSLISNISQLNDEELSDLIDDSNKDLGD